MEVLENGKTCRGCDQWVIDLIDIGLTEAGVLHELQCTIRISTQLAQLRCKFDSRKAEAICERVLYFLRC